MPRIEQRKKKGCWSQGEGGRISGLASVEGPLREHTVKGGGAATVWNKQGP